MKLFGVLAEPRARLVVPHLDELSPEHSERDLAHAHGRVYVGVAEPLVHIRVEPAGVEPCLVLGNSGGGQLEGELHLVNEAMQIRARTTHCLDLDALQTLWIIVQWYLRGVERDLADADFILAFAGGTPDREPLAAGPDLKQWNYLVSTEEHRQPLADGATGLLERCGSIDFERLGDLAPPPETALGGR